MGKTFTDRRLLRKIYDRYYDDFVAFDRSDPKRAAKVYVPIDCAAIAKEFGTDPDIVFGRLYYHLDKKYGYKKEDGAKVSLFSMETGSDRHTVHFPLLAAVLAEHEQSYYRFLVPLWASLAALAFSVYGLLANGT
ncbi:MAG: hypothetical protein H6953_02885 [Chromatiaceae bacterium]|nr:hypothetical protein [Chromatiaceae bacterium]MCP5314097.1 hypothetical protein [Chromatiaceae bacterium]